MTHEKSDTPIPLWLALLPLAFLIALLSLSVSLFGDGSSYGPNQISLLLAAGVAGLVGLYLRIPWAEIETAMVESIMLAMKAILIALEPKYGKVEGTGVLERSGFSPDLIKSMLEDNALWAKPLQFVRERATKLKVGDFIQTPSDSEYIDENATLGKAAHQLIVQPHLSLLVTSGDEVVGILRLSDVFSKVCDIIKDD